MSRIVKCPHCSNADKSLLESIDRWLWLCRVCGRTWSFITPVLGFYTHREDIPGVCPTCRGAWGDKASPNCPLGAHSNICQSSTMG